MNNNTALKSEKEQVWKIHPSYTEKDKGLISIKGQELRLNANKSKNLFIIKLNGFDD